MESLYQYGYEDLALAACDTATGAGVAALTSLSSVGGAWLGVCVAGAAGGVALAAFERSRRHADVDAGVIRALLRIALSAGQLFAMWESKDPDVGAGLVAIPLFFVACTPPIGRLSEYVGRSRILSSFLNAACVASAVLYFTLEGKAAAPRESAWFPEAGQRQFLAAVDLAYAASAPWPGANSLPVTGLRGLLFGALGAFPAAARGLLRGPLPDWLLALYGASLAQSVHVHACDVRLGLSGPKQQRRLMLLVTPALAVAFVSRNEDPALQSLGVLVVLVLGVLLWAAQQKPAHRHY